MAVAYLKQSPDEVHTEDSPGLEAVQGVLRVDVRGRTGGKMVVTRRTRVLDCADWWPSGTVS